MKVSELLDYLDSERIAYTYSGDRELEVASYSSLSRYKPGSFTWVKTAGNIPEGFDFSQIALAIVSEGIAGAFRNVVYTPQSKRAFFSAIEHFFEKEEERPSVGQHTYLSPEVKLGKNVRIGHNCTLDGKITIGDNTVIWNNVVIINRVVIGADCEIRSGAVIGHDGYAYTEDGNYKKQMVKHHGGVSIGDDVLIGENACVHRGTIDDTVIESGVKIDTLSHIAHNCWMERNSAMAGPCRASGSVHIGENAYLAGCIVRNQKKIGRNAFVGVGAVVVKDVGDGETVVGNPARPFRKAKM